MDSLQKIRVFAAAAISPIVVPLLVYLTFLFIFGTDVDKDQEIQTSISTASWISYGFALALGIGGYILMRVKGWQSMQRFMIAGAMIGVLCWLLFSLISWKILGFLFFVFIIAGFLMGTSFWFIAYFKPDGSHASNSRRKRRRTI